MSAVLGEMDQLQDPNSELSYVFPDIINDEEHIPLNTRWTFWINCSERGLSIKEYEERLHKIYTVTTVQKFWSVYNNIPDIRELKNKYSYHLMREELRPVWEDEANQRGGAWHIKVHKKDSPLIWKELLLAAIGEQFLDDVKDGDDVCGVSVTVRDRNDVIQIWNVDATKNSDGIIGKVRRLVPTVYFATEYYRPHMNHTSYEGASRGACDEKSIS